MSNDRNQDEQVSEAYKSLADERTPQHLDQKILQMAGAQVSRPLYSRWIRWTRPLAWAATITLCLAITLELTREQTLETALQPTMEMNAPASQRAPERVSAPREGYLHKDEEAQFLESELPEKEQARDIPDALADAIASEKTALGRSAARQSVAEPAPTTRLRPTADEDAAGSVAADEVEERKARTNGYAVRAETSSGQMMMSAEVEAEADLVMQEIVVVNECTDDIRSEPETWLECILDLEAAGDEEAAERQREELIDTFPDFKMP